MYGKMILVTIDSNNIRSAIAIQRELFPDYDATVNYVEAVEGISGNEYWILSVEGALVGISGRNVHYMHRPCRTRQMYIIAIYPLF